MVHKGETQPDPENLRVEYALAAQYHNSLVGIRFVIAGFFVAATGFVLRAVFDKDMSWEIKAVAGVVGGSISLCVWLLELRTRCLYQNLAHRCIEIEHRYWGIEGSDWYKGLFSRQYKERPPDNYSRKEEVPAVPPPDRPEVPWLTRKPPPGSSSRPLLPRLVHQPLPTAVSEYVSHSWAFDLLYLGALLFWLIVAAVSLYKLV